MVQATPPTNAARPSRHHGHRLLAVALFVQILSGCNGLGQSRPARLFAIELPAVSNTSDCAISFSIRDLTLAGYLDRLEVVSDRRDNEIYSSASDLWAAPLKDELRRLISVSLNQRWRNSRAVAYPWRFQELPTLALSLSVDRLEPNGKTFESAIRWQAFKPGDAGRATELIAAGVHQQTRPQPRSDAAQTARATATAIDDFSADLVRQLPCPANAIR